MKKEAGSEKDSLLNGWKLGQELSTSGGIIQVFRVLRVFNSATRWGLAERWMYRFGELVRENRTQVDVQTRAGCRSLREFNSFLW